MFGLNVYVRLRALVVPWVAALVLAGCTTTNLTSAYDAQIDKGMLQYATDLESHIALQVLLKEEPGYTYKQNLEFYAKQKGILGGLILRASASDPGKGCMISDQATKFFGDKLPSALSGALKNYNPDGDGCTVIMLKNVRTQLDQIAKLEKTMQGFNRAAGVSALQISSQAIRAVLALEAMKKKGLEG